MHGVFDDYNTLFDIYKLKNDKNKYIPLAQHVVGTYSGKLSANYRTVEDAYIVKVIELTDKTVQVQASFFPLQRIL